MRYCPSCREEFPGDTPPYSVIHVMTEPPTHLVPDTREPVSTE